jgi:NAD(P)-dependent dehydrogenase (short-subunit alcohol dehydrogenase family)
VATTWMITGASGGLDFLGAVEEQAEEDYRQTFEVNFFGAVALTRLALPLMRERGRGTIVNISSMDGIVSLPVNGYYSASKFALEGITEALWQEVEPLGLKALLIELGSFRTGIDQRTRFSGQQIDAYEATSGVFRKIMQTAGPELFPGDPALAAAAIYDVMSANPAVHRVILGSDAYRRIEAKLQTLQAELEAGRDLAYTTDYKDLPSNPGGRTLDSLSSPSAQSSLRHVNHSKELN